MRVTIARCNKQPFHRGEEKEHERYGPGQPISPCRRRAPAGRPRSRWVHTHHAIAYEGERAATALQVVRLRAKLGKQWNDLLV